MRDTVLGVLGFALLLFPTVELHAFICLSNHYHMLVSVSDPETLARFMSFFNGNVARKVSKLIGWSGPFWSRRYSDIPVIDDVASVERLDYCFQNGCKECLVSSPLEWPGATTARVLALGEPLRGKWTNETELSKARRHWRRAGREANEPEPTAASFTREITIHVAPLPCWREKSEYERRHLVGEIVRRIEGSMVGVDVVGVERLRAQDPLEEPTSLPSHSDEPKCLSSTEEGWFDYVTVHRARVETYRTTSAQLRSGERPKQGLPEFTLPPPMHFRPSQNLPPLTWGARSALLQ